MATVLSTWSWGAAANGPAMRVLRGGGSALDAVVEGASAVEADEAVNSVGRGGMPDASGRVSLDACVMTDPDRAGAVAYVRRCLHVTRLARCVMERTVHILLAGDGAEAFAESQGLPMLNSPEELLTADARAKWEAWRAKTIDRDAFRGWIPPLNAEERTRAGREQSPPVAEADGHDTVGVLARDRAGRLAGACSTSGMAFKVPGRVGDSPIVGHGLYVDQQAGAATATGNGELVMGVCGSFLAVERMRMGDSPVEACLEVLRRIASRFGSQLTNDHQVALIALRSDGQWGSAALRPGFTVIVSEGEADARPAPPHAVVLE